MKNSVNLVLVHCLGNTFQISYVSFEIEDLFEFGRWDPVSRRKERLDILDGPAE